MFRLERKVRVRGEERIEYTASRIYTNLVFSTPVDEGTARSNYRIGLGKAKLDTVKSISAQAAITRGNAAIGKFKLSVHKGIHITNNLPYIVPLNEGHSSQAPANFIELAIRQGVVESSSFKIVE